MGPLLDILVTVVPVFLVLGAGAAAVRGGIVTPGTIDGAMVFAQGIALPCLLFAAVARLDLGDVFDPGLLVSFYGAATVTFALGVVGARILFRRRPGEAVAIGFGALFSNSLLLGLPITERAFGTDALAPNIAIISIHAPYCYLIGIVTMEIARADGRGVWATVRAVGRAVGRNGLMIGLAIGFGVNATGGWLPEPVWVAVDMMAQAALPAALFGLGGVLTRYALRESLGEASMVAVLSLILHPALAYALGVWVFDLPQGFVNSLVITAAMAPGVNAYLFANMYGRAQGAAASAVLLSTGLCVLSASVWLYILRG